MPLTSTTPAIPFPLYLLPSIPFRRRRRSSTTTNSSSPSSSPPTKPTSYLPATSPPSTLRCHKCLSDLIPTTSIVSKGFTGRHGRAYLVSPPPPSAMSPCSATTAVELASGDLPNTHLHKPVPRQLVTGAHTVSDVSCRNCGTVLGWKYVDAEEEAQKYKVGKFILETRRVVRGVGWDAGADGALDAAADGAHGPAARVDEEVEFDSQDEDECEDLFAGIWSPQLARKRRRNRVASAT